MGSGVRGCKTADEIRYSKKLLEAAANLVLTDKEAQRYVRQVVGEYGKKAQLTESIDGELATLIPDCIQLTVGIEG